MFLWARPVFDQIRDSPSKEAIIEALQQALEGLDERQRRGVKGMHQTLYQTGTADAH